MNTKSILLIVIIGILIMGLFGGFFLALGVYNVKKGGGLDKATGVGGGANTACVDLSILQLDGQADILKRIVKNQPVYEAAAAKSGISWQMLAALHVREHSALNDNPPNNEGPFQLHSLALRNPNHPALKSLEAAADFAANALVTDYSRRYKPHNSLGVLSASSPNELIASTFWAYNGLINTLEESSYTWNHLDASHNGPDQKGMHFPSSYDYKGVDGRDGVFAMYAFLRYGSEIEGDTVVARPCQTILLAGESVGPLPSKNGFAIPVADFKKFVPLKPHHRGYKSVVAVDIKVETGTDVFAVQGGKVEAVLRGGDCGNGVKILGSSGDADTHGLHTLYCHFTKVDSSLIVGKEVSAGQHLGKSGSTGHSTGPHLHLQGEGAFLNKYPTPDNQENSLRERAWRQFLDSLAQ